MEEETEAAMATDQFSSSDDIFSKLPEHIIHCILGFLPSTKDVVRTSAISKFLLRAWLTFPVTEFNLEEFVCLESSAEVVEAKSKQFIGFVDSTLQRVERQNGDGNGNRMKIFNLSTVNKMAHHHSPRWIGIALDNQVEHLALRILEYDYSSELPILIPDRVLSAYWLKSLTLDGDTIYIPLTEYCRLDLPSLTSLRIEYCDIPNEQLQKLLSGCPALEEIALLFCHSLSKVDIFDHPNLETLQVYLRASNRADHSAIKVRAPKLKSFKYLDSRGDVVVNILNSPELKSLRITDRKKTDEWFHKFLAQFPLIEDLTIDWCNALRNIRISNPLLEKINIFHCNNLKDVVISCETLASFLLSTRGTSIPKPSIRMEMDNPLNDCTAQITVESINTEWDLPMDASWYCKMKEFLSGPVTFKSLNLRVETWPDVDGDMNGEDVHKRLPPAACNIEKLRLNVTGRSLYHSHILNGFLSVCHPTAIKLEVIPNNDFVELVCKELGKRKNNRKCWCKDDFKCWKHQLKEVKIEKITGIKLEEGLEWDALFNLLPTLKVGNDIYFKLMW